MVRSAVRTDGGVHLAPDVRHGMLAQYRAFGQTTDDVIMDFVSDSGDHHRLVVGAYMMAGASSRHLSSSMSLHINGYENHLAVDAKRALAAEFLASPMSCPVSEVFWHLENRYFPQNRSFEITLYCAFLFRGEAYMARGTITLTEEMAHNNAVRSSQDVADMISKEVRGKCLDQLERNFGPYLGSMLHATSEQEVAMLLSPSSTYSPKRAENRRQIEQLTHGVRPHMLDIIPMPPEPVKKSRRRLNL